MNVKTNRDVLGIDIGGANLKAAHSSGVASSMPFPLWQRPEELADQLRRLASRMPPAVKWAVSMTGELCDCFATKRQGVHHIIDHTVRAAGPLPVIVWQLTGRFVTSDVARADVKATAASNWHALATFAAREFCSDQCGLLIDVGSTTTDIVLLDHSVVASTGFDDTQRLSTGELVYSGVIRTPVASLVRNLPICDQLIPVAAELFATTLDAYLLLNNLPEDALQMDTANGQEATRSAAADRLSRMICADREHCSDRDLKNMARYVADAQFDQLTTALHKVIARATAPIEIVVTSGSGEFLARRLVDRLDKKPRLFSVSEAISPGIAQAACAWALARLAVTRSSS